MARLLLLVFVLLLLMTVLRGLRIFFTAVFRKPGPGPAREQEMVRDPVCGTWIDRRLALEGRRGADSVPVCSEDCRRRLEAG